MRQIMMEVPHNIAAGTFEQIQTPIRDILSQWCSHQLVSHKLTPSSFRTPINIRVSGHREGNRVFNKLSSLIERALLKERPYLEYSKYNRESLLKGESSRIGRAFTTEVVSNIVDIPVNVYRTLGGFSMTSIRSSWAFYKEREEGWSEWEIPEVVDNLEKTLSRYSKYLEYKAIKHAVPFSMSCASYQLTAINTLEKDQALSADHTDTKDLTLKCVLTAYVVVHVCKRFHRRVGKGKDFSSMEELIQNTPEDQRANIYNPDNWVNVGLMEHSDGEFTLVSADMSKYCTVERIFVFLPEFMQCLKTLSRKTYYVSDAFRVNDSGPT